MDSGWEAVLKGGGWPALAVAVILVVFRGPALVRGLMKDWRGETAKEEDRLDQQRDAFWTVKDREMERLRSEVTTQQGKVEALLARIEQLMASIGWWREYARDMRHERLNERLLHQNYERLHGIEPLPDEDVPPVPRVSEEDTAAEFQRMKPGAD